MISFRTFLLVSLFGAASGFSLSRQISSSRHVLLILHSQSHSQSETAENTKESLLDLDPEISKQFTIKTCSATSCAKKSQSFGLDEYALYSGLYVRK